MLRRLGWTLGAALTAAALSSAQAQISFIEVKPPDSAEHSGFYNKLYFVGDSIGFMIGEQTLEDMKATVSFTHDRGKTWEMKNALAPDRLMGGSFVDEKYGWAVGENGSVLHTEDGGANWVIQTSKVVVDLQAAFFLDEKTGWAVGSNSTVLQTTNGGLTWRTLQGGIPSEDVGEGETNFLDVHFFDQRNGIVIGAGRRGVVMTTSDGGTAWEEAHVSDTNFASMAFGDENRGWIVGTEGALIASDDGGKTWTPQESGAQEDLKDIAAGGPEIAWYSGEGGAIGYTADGGKTWNPVEVSVEFFGEQKPLRRTVSGVAAFQKKAWAMTDYGRVIHFLIK